MGQRLTIDDPIGSIALLDEPTRRRLYDVVAGADAPVGRDEAAAALGISRELAAFHLERLAAGGLLDTEYRRLSGRTGPGAGRPAKLYRRAEGDLSVTLPTRNYDLAADVMAEALEALGRRGSRAVAPVARERGRKEASERVTTLEPSAPPPDRSRLLMDALEGAGYAPETEPDGSVRLRNCPYDALAQDHRDLTCGMSAAWAEGVVEGLGAPMSVELAPVTGAVLRGLSPAARAARRLTGPVDLGGGTTTMPIPGRKTMRSRWILVCVALAALVGCSAAGATAPPSPSAPVPPLAPSTGPSPTTLGTAMASDQPITETARRMLDLAQAHLAAGLNVSLDQITTAHVEAVQWPNAGLGCPKPGVDYLPMPRPGYRISLEVQGTTYEYHADQNNRVIQCRAIQP